MKIDRFLITVFIIAISAFYACSQEDYKSKDLLNVYTNKDSHHVDNYYSRHFNTNSKPENIVLLIGDGMGVSQVFAGVTANKGNLFLMNFKCIGFSRTQSSSDYITDSAAGATAISSGTKTYNGAIGVDDKKEALKTILEIAEENGKATGLVSTSAITHATPASFIAHQPSRNMYEEIAADFLKTDIDVFIGGGRDHFTSRKDGENLLDKFKEKGYKIYDNLTDAEAVTSGKLGVLTAPMHNPKFSERGNMLVESTSKALEILSKDRDGFFLMVEGSQIDWGGHNNNIGYIVGEMLDFDRAIGEVLKFAMQNQETLIIVTADHETGGLALSGGNIAEGYVEGDFTTTHHTGVMVPVFAIGPGAEEFMGIYENTAIFDKMLELFQFRE